MRLRRQRARSLVRKISVAAAAFSILSTGGLAIAGVLPTPLQHAVARAADSISLPISVPYPDFPEAPATTEPVVQDPAPRPVEAATSTPTAPTTSQPAVAEEQTEEGSGDCGSEGGAEACGNDDQNPTDSGSDVDSDRDASYREAGGREDSRDNGDDDESESESRNRDDADRERGNREERQRGDDADRAEDDGESSGERSEDDGDGSAEGSEQGHP